APGSPAGAGSGRRSVLRLLLRNGAVRQDDDPRAWSGLLGRRVGGLARPGRGRVPAHPRALRAVVARRLLRHHDPPGPGPAVLGADARPQRVSQGPGVRGDRRHGGVRAGFRVRLIPRKMVEIATYGGWTMGKPVLQVIICSPRPGRVA